VSDAELAQLADAKGSATQTHQEEEGLSQNSIKTAIGCSKDTVNKVIAGRNKPSAQNDHQEESTPIAEDDSPFFDEEECDTTEAVNPESYAVGVVKISYPLKRLKTVQNERPAENEQEHALSIVWLY